MFLILVTTKQGNTVQSIHESDKDLARIIYNHLKHAADMSGYNVSIEKGS